ncbi:MAG: carboxypeptidase-like regulatory domain-containing protein [Methylococcales bacterium]|nr:carboxypeptidase-like regulatory domain-containing protein [Methylococcales bacterium]
MKTWSSWETIRRQVAICGRVLDESGERVCGVRVNIVSMPEVFLTRVSTVAGAAEKKWDDLEERLDRTATRMDGIFYFLDLPAGQYTLSFDTQTDSRDKKKVAVIWDIFPAVKDEIKGNIVAPCKLMPHVPFKIPGVNPVEYKIEGR